MMFKQHTIIQALQCVDVRRTPGYSNKSADDILRTLKPGEKATVNFPLELWNDLIWMQVTFDSDQIGWVSETSADGTVLFEAQNQISQSA